MINKRFFKRLGQITDQLYEVELAKSEFELEEPITVGFYFLTYAKLGVLELYCNFFTKLCDADSYDEMEIDT